MAKKSDYVGIADAAEILGVKPDNARAIINWSGVESKEGECSAHPITGKPFGKPAKLYSVAGLNDLVAKVKG